MFGFRLDFRTVQLINIIEAIKFLHEGGIGDVYMARGLCIKPRDSFGIAKDSEPPATLHYDNGLDLLPGVRTMKSVVITTGTGSGIPEMVIPETRDLIEFEIARWGLNKNEHPVSVYSDGGIYGIDPKECAQETPNTQSSLFKYSDGKMLEFETRGRYSNAESSLDIKIGNMFYGTEGYLELRPDRYMESFP